MKPQILVGLVATAVYTLSGCSQNTHHMQQPQKVVSHHISYQKQKVVHARKAASKAAPQRQVAPQSQVARQQQHVVPQRQVAQHRQVARHQQVARNHQVYRQTPIHYSGSVPQLTQQEIRRIGDQIFNNESGGKIDKLVHWNVGENFAAMGIGHFTWYPAGRRARFGNTFPGMLSHLEKRGVQLPGWLQQAKHSGAPWRTRGQMMSAKNTPRVQQLQRLLYETRYLQAEYIAQRAQRAMPKLVKTAPPQLRPIVANNLNAVANTQGGWYALIDYVNFKGEGLNRRGGYRGQNWGLLQVLEEMRPTAPGPQALHQFADAAMRVLNRRVRNSPSGRGEARWLAGWNNRVSTYRRPS